MRPNRNVAIYALLAAGWLGIAGWQTSEHKQIGVATRQALLARAHDISTSLGVVIRSQGRFGMVARPRLEAALEELAKTSEILAVDLLDLYGNTVASAGEPVSFDLSELAGGEVRWGLDTLMVANVVELGPRVEEGLTSATRHMEEPGRPRDREGRPEWPLPPWIDEGQFTVPRDRMTTAALYRQPPGAPHEKAGLRGEPRGEGRGDGPPRRDRPPRGRPPWISEERFNQLMRLEGPYYLVLLLSRGSAQAVMHRDLWLRMGLVAIAFVAAIGLGAAWRGGARSVDLEVRLARAQEMNTVLREMNLAAAGLAHETRNPLNIVRGLAQIISKSVQTAEENRAKAQSIIEEVDRVASRLNEFIDYSKPREAKTAPTNLKSLAAEVERALETDREDKRIQFAIEGPDLSVGADEPLLRQALFNLLLNAYKAVDAGGKVTVAVVPYSPREAWLEVRDNGPGVPPEAREAIFRPYYTTREDGAGLGLAVVRQIVQAHRWEIECLTGDDGLSIFRIRGLRIV